MGHARISFAGPMLIAPRGLLMMTPPLLTALAGLAQLVRARPS